MSVIRHISQGRRILVFPGVVVSYLCYIAAVSYAAEYVLAVPMVATLLIEPLLFSYIAGRFFIDAVDPARLPEHWRIRWRFFAPFLAIFGALFLASIVGQAIYFRFMYRDAGVSAWVLALYGFLSALVIFWMTAVIFMRGNVLKGLGAALRLMRENPAPAALFFLGYFIFEIFHEFFGFGSLKSSHAIPFFVLHGAYAAFDLYVSRIAVSLAAGSRFLPDANATLDGYIAGERARGQVPDEARQKRRANVCLLLGVLSMIPGVHCFAAVLGWERFRHQQYGRFRSMTGCILGIFFTVLYCSAILGNMLTRERRAGPPAHVSSLELYLNDPATAVPVRQIIRQLRSGRRIDHRALAGELEAMKEDRSQARYFALGLAHGYAYNAQESLAAFKQCLQLPDWSPEALFHIGRIHLFQTHDFFEARNYLARFLKYHPQDTTALRYISLIDNRVAWDKNWIISLLSVIALLTAITCHEYGHSYAAYKCGDPTPRDAGRLSLNPIVHLDLFGSIILPASLILSHSGVIVGWAKPVPVNPDNFRNPGRDTALVSVMGCFTNFSVAMAATVVLALASASVAVFVPDFISLHWLYPAGVISAAGVPFAKFWIYGLIFISLVIMINIAVGLFNLIPIPPLDGSWIIERRLRPVLGSHYGAYQQFSFLLILILLFSDVIDVVIGSVLNAYFVYLQVVLGPALNLT